MQRIIRISSDPIEKIFGFGKQTANEHVKWLQLKLPSQN